MVVCGEECSSVWRGVCGQCSIAGCGLLLLCVFAFAWERWTLLFKYMDDPSPY